MRAKRHLLTRTIREILKSGMRHPEGNCSLPKPIYGSARVQVILHLSRHDLLWVKNWRSGCSTA